MGGPATVSGDELTLGTEAGLIQIRGSVAETASYKGSEDVIEFALTDPALVTPIIDFVLPAEALTSETVALTATVDAQGATTVSDSDVVYAVLSGPGEVTDNQLLAFTGTGRVIVSASLAATTETNAVVSQSSVEVIALYSLSGTVKDVDGNVFNNGFVIVADINDVANSESVNIANDGSYSFASLRSGDYELFVTPLDAAFALTFYGDVSPVLDATVAIPVLNITGDTENIDITIQAAPASAVEFLPEDQGGTIEFQAQNVTSGGNRFVQGRTEMGDPLPNTLVILKTQADEYVAADVTDDLGFITFTGLPTGDYKLVLDIPGVGELTASVGVVEGEMFEVTALIDESGGELTVDMVLSTLPTEVTELRLYPNPASDYFQLQSARKIEEVVLFDINGRELKRYDFRINMMFGI